MVRNSKSNHKAYKSSSIVAVSSSVSSVYDLPPDHPDVVAFHEREEGCIETKTRKNYDDRYQQFLEYVMIEKPELVSGNPPDIHTEPPLTIVQGYWSHISTIKKGKRAGKPASKSYMGQHSSGLKFNFEKRNWDKRWIEEETRKFNKSHVKVVAKVKGKDGDVEGKRPMEFDEFRIVTHSITSHIRNLV